MQMLSIQYLLINYLHSPVLGHRILVVGGVEFPIFWHIIFSLNFINYILVLALANLVLRK